VQSEVYVGSTFTMRVALHESDTVLDQFDKHPPEVLAIGSGQRNYRMLVVDDKWENRLMVVRMLESVGFSVREAENGEEAIQIWQEWQPDMIWMDMRMPIMSGIEATQTIRALPKGEDVIIVALTASAFEHERQEMLKAGCNDYIAKPFANNLLFDKIRKYLKVEFEYEKIADLPVSHGLSELS